MPPQINFRQIRSHNGSQDRGFEELCYELVPSIENLPSDTKLVRHGNPDGGVEFRASFSNGQIWAWQAKYLFSLRPAQFAQLNLSVKRALDSQPSLTRYTFCLPYDRPAGAVPGRKSAMQRWNERCEKWKDWARRKGMSVEFNYIGESELVSALTLSSQSGRARYWFDATILSQQWFETAMERAIADAGERYTPKLNVELPIATVFDGLGKTKEFEKRVRLALRQVRDTRRWYTASNKDLLAKEPVLEEKLRAGETALDTLDAAILSVDFASEKDIDFQGLIRFCTEARDRVEDVAEILEEKERRQREQDPKRDLLTKLDSALWELRRTNYALEEMIDLLSSDSARLVNLPALLVTGAPGTGKTHLLCDVADKRCAAGLPSILIHGRHLARGEPWAQVLNLLGVQCSVEEFLGALDVAAEVAGSRGIIFIDAVNEGEGTILWADHLNGFLSRLRRWPRLGAAMTCRTSYLKTVLPEGMDEGRLVQVEHQGFSGHEYEAVKLFFGEYGLVMPNFPLLVPEFQNAQFLKLMCKGLRETGSVTLPRGSTGVTWLYRTFLTSVDLRLARQERCDYDPALALAWRAVREIGAQMLAVKREWLSTEEAEAVCSGLLERDGWSNSLLNGLLSEGVLMREPRLTDDGSEMVLFSYQRMGDYLRAKALVESTQDVRGLTAALTPLTGSMNEAYRNSGLLEALSVVVPETYSLELHRLITGKASEGVVKQAFLESLIWRDPAAFQEPLPLDYLNKVPFEAALLTLLQVACIPGHPFNAELLHKSLWRMSMPDRDASWSRFIHSETDANESPVVRMITWAWLDDTSYCADDAALLCATTLAWVLASSNRFLRDRATKALVALLKNRPGVLSELLRRFADVNDLYVAERLYAAAYGCCLISQDATTVGQVAQLVYEQVFAGAHPPAHILLRDYARGVIERALQLGCSLPDVDVALVRPPYHSPWPITAPSVDSLAKRYHRGSDYDYYSIWSSVSDWMGDFHKYVMEPSLDEFLAPGQERRLASARAAARRRASEARKALLKTLSPREIRAMEEEAARDPLSLLGRSSPREFIEYRHEKGLARDPRPITFDIKLAARFILNRVLSLGWTPKRFRDFDQAIGHYGATRTGHKSERIGKKYQWISLHELLARVADHCEYRSRWGQSDDMGYEGPWQIGRRDIDPSLLLRKSPDTDDVGQECWWLTSAIDVPIRPTSHERETWLCQTSGLAIPETLIDLTDRSGNRWMVLEGYYHWDEETPPEEDRYRVERCESWYQIRAYLMQQSTSPEFETWAKGNNWMGRWMPESADLHDLLGEYPWHPSMREFIRDSESDRGMREDVQKLNLIIPAASYLDGSGGFDCSLEDTVRGFLPSPYVARALGLHWSGRQFEYEDCGGCRATWDPTAEVAGPPVLLVERGRLLQMLKDKGLAIAWTVLGEKRVLGPIFAEQRTNRLEICGAFTLKGRHLKLVSFETVYIDND